MNRASLCWLLVQLDVPNFPDTIALCPECGLALDLAAMPVESETRTVYHFVCANDGCKLKPSFLPPQGEIPAM